MDQDQEILEQANSRLLEMRQAMAQATPLTLKPLPYALRDDI